MLKQLLAEPQQHTSYSTDIIVPQTNIGHKLKRRERFNMETRKWKNNSYWLQSVHYRT